MKDIVKSITDLGDIRGHTIVVELDQDVMNLHIDRIRGFLSNLNTGAKFICVAQGIKFIKKGNAQEAIDLMKSWLGGDEQEQCESWEALREHLDIAPDNVDKIDDGDGEEQNESRVEYVGLGYDT